MEHPQPYIIAKTSTMAELLCFYITFHGHFCGKIGYAIQVGFALCDCQLLTNSSMSSNSWVVATMPSLNLSTHVLANKVHSM
jgi:hypothetical protein